MDWTDARRKAFIISTLRSGSRRWPPKYITLNAAKTEKKINPKSGRLAQHFVCNTCQGEFTNKDMEVDHIMPIVDPIRGFVDWNTFVERLFCNEDNLQAICKPCHKEKSKTERKTKV